MRFICLPILAFVTACSAGSHSVAQKEIPIDFAPPQEVVWQNPAYTTCKDAAHPKAHPHMKFVPDGLTLLTGDEPTTNTFDGKSITPVTLGKNQVKFDTRKKTAIFVLGYAQAGEAYDFFETKKWQKEYNTFVFRWHCQYFAEDNIFSDIDEAVAAASAHLTSDLKRLDALLGRWYEPEIRLITISMGAPVALNAALETFKGRSLLTSYSSGTPRYQRRIDMLDPAIFGDFAIAESIRTEDGLTRFPSQYADAAKKIIALQGEGVAFSAFTTAYGRIFTRGMYRWVNVQEYNSDWLMPEIQQRIRQKEDREPSFVEVIHYQHIGIVPAYFASIEPSVHPTVINSTKYPRGITALTPTRDLRRSRVYLRQLANPGRDTLTFADDEFEEIEPCPRGVSINYERSPENLFNSVYWSAFRKCL